MDCCESIENKVHEKPGHKHEAHDAGHDKHAGHHTQDFIKKFWISLVLTAPLLLYRNLNDYVAMILGSVIFFYCGWVFLSSAWRELKARLPGMMTLIALATTTAFVWSVYSTISHSGHTLWWELSTLIAIMLIGHWVEMKAVQGAQGALKELAKLLPDTAEVIREEKNIILPLSELKIGDVVLIRPGGKVPADGKIIEGSSELNEAIITGESRPVAKSIDDQVIAGAINGDGSLKVEIMKIGQDTFLSGVMRLVADAQRSKSRLQMLSDRAAFYLTIVAVSSGVITLVAWLIAGASASDAIERVVAVLVIACPHALGLAIPLVASISTTMAAKNGLLIRQRLALEAARKIDVVIFDKTGTLTKGEFEVVGVISDEILSIAAAVERYSEHPIAKAINNEAKKRNVHVPQSSGFKRIAGFGAEAMVEGKKVFVGHKGGIDIVVEVDNKPIGIVIVKDAIRPEAKESVEQLKKLGLEVAMITGDSEDVAREVAKELGIDIYFARVRPEEKAQKVKQLQSNGKKVAMVGDGVNDAPALSQADLGIAIGAGTNVAIESAGIILVKSDPRDISKIVRLSQLTYSKMVQNLFWATGYNLLALPIAAGVLAPWGIILQPAVAAVFMSLSTIIVSVNAVLLRRKSLAI